LSAYTGDQGGGGRAPGLLRDAASELTNAKVRELRETLSASTIALEISSRNARVQALQKRWDYLRAGLDLILDQRGADMADMPGGASELLRDYMGKEAGVLATRIDPVVVSLVAELRGHERQLAEEMEPWKNAPRGERGDRRLAGGDYIVASPQPGCAGSRRTACHFADYLA
jgi:hypothetical protein